MLRNLLYDTATFSGYDYYFAEYALRTLREVLHLQLQEIAEEEGLVFKTSLDAERDDTVVTVHCEDDPEKSFKSPSASLVKMLVIDEKGAIEPQAQMLLGAADQQLIPEFYGLAGNTIGDMPFVATLRELMQALAGDDEDRFAELAASLRERMRSTTQHLEELRKAHYTPAQDKN